MCSGRAQADVDAKIVQLQHLVEHLEEALNLERRRGVDEGRASPEAVLRSSYDQAPHPVAILDPDGTLRYANRAVRTLVSQDSSAITGRMFWEIPWWTHSEDERNKVRNGVRCGARETIQFETAIRSTEGALRYLDLTIRPVADDAGTVSFLVAEGWDVTEHKRAEDVLRKSEARYRALTESQVDLVSRYRPDTILTFVNDAYCRFYGKMREQLVGQSFLTMVDRKFHEFVLKETASLVENPGPIVREYQNLRKDGEACWIQWVVHGVIDESGRVSELQAVGRDITRLKKAEEALRQANLVVESSPMVLFRRKAIAGWPVEYVSANVIQFGYTPQELLIGSTPYATLICLDDRELVAERLQQCSEIGRDHLQQEYRIVAKGGGLRWVEDRTSIERNAEGQATHYQSIVIDITERKKGEEERNALQGQLQQAMKMEAVGRLAGGVAHDFNNLLTAIAGNIAVAKMQLKTADPLSQYLDDMNDATERAASLIRQLLAFSRRQVIEPRILNLNDLVDNLRKMLVRVIGEDIALSVALSPNLGAVKADPGQFEQVLINLAVNARDAMPNGGKLVIETANTVLDQSYCARHPYVTPGSFVMLSVSDTGHGMSPEVQQHLFEPFFTTKPAGRGTGLGLATIFGIVKQSGGSIEAYSEAGRGATFKIYLPKVLEPATRSVKTTPTVGVPQGEELILFVEDDASVRKLALSFLERLGYQVLVATNGAEALALAEAHGAQIDLLFTDVVMPGMTGHELSERLLRLHPKMKVLFSSGYAENVIVHHGVIDGQVNFIGKPYSVHELAEAVRAVLDRE